MCFFYRCLTITCVFIILSAFPVQAQKKFISGFVKDQFSGEAVPFASISFKKVNIGTQTDSAGYFAIVLPALINDTFIITSVGYEDYLQPLDKDAFKNDSLLLNINMTAGKFNLGVVVSGKANKGLQMWKRIVKNKPQNDRYSFQNFSYTIYNKLELDIKNVSKEKFNKIPFLKKFNFILDNIDSSEGDIFLPLYLTEAVSDYYYQRNPQKRREVFKAVKTIGVENESIRKYLGGMDQNVNVYNNFIPVFNKQFISPISDNGDNYYNYKVSDTQYVSGRRLIHFLFIPKRKSEGTFEGDCWVHDTSYAIQKMNLRVSGDANINFLNRLTIIQEYSLLNDSSWFLSKDKFIADISPMGDKRMAFIGRKTSTYRNITINNASVIEEVEKNKILEEIIVPPGVEKLDEEEWKQLRHEELNNTEKAIYKMIDTLTNLPSFKRFSKAMNFIGTGYFDKGKLQFGPWQNWVFSNAEEGLRLRFDGGTTALFSKKINLHSYVAYGFNDKKWKGQFDVFYLMNRQPRTYLFASYINDFDYAQNYYDEISTDNIFALAVRKNNVPIKFLKTEEYKINFSREWKSGFSVLLSSSLRKFDPVRNLPGKSFFTPITGEPLAGYEASIRFRYAFLERFIENTFSRISLGSPYPIVELKYARGIKGVLSSAYTYNKISGNLSNTSKIPPYGNIYYNIFAGKTSGVLPFMFLDIAPGNEIYYYNRYAFNMMNRFEYLHDRYTGFNIEHNFGNGLFRFLPLLKNVKWRQLWTAKGLWGKLSEENKILNFVADAPFRSLNGKPYFELGTGVENILKVLRIDFIWRLTPVSEPKNTNNNFGVFGSFRLSF